MTAKRDAWLWGLAAAAVTVAMPVGRVSPDGLGLATRVAAGAWQPNPNHLLLEPIGALTLWATSFVAPEALAVDRLRVASALAGALAVAIFRASVAPRFSETRRAASFATAWMALGAGFSQLWISAECHLVQMPPVVVATALLLRLREHPTREAAIALGAAIGVATLCFSSLALLVPFAALALAPPFRRGSRRGGASEIGWMSAAFAITAGVPAVAVWWVSARGGGVGLVDWLLSYGGAGDLGRLGSAYGVALSPSGVALAGSRAVYGAASALVDLAPSIAGWRDAGEFACPIVRTLVAVAAGLALATGLGDRRRDWLALALFLVAPVLLFGFAWNDSDEQFYLPLAIVLGALAGAAAAGPRWVVALGILGLAWNAGDLALRFVLDPRAALVAELSRATRDSCLVIHPGFDEAEPLLRLGGAPPAAELLSLAELAVATPGAEGLAILRARAERCLTEGGAVAFVNVYDRPPFAPPWKFLRSLGYDPAHVRAAFADSVLEPVDVPSRRFTVRRMKGRP